MIPTNFRFGFRALLKTPRFTLLAVAILALGIGATSAMFSVTYSVLLRPLPYQDPSRLAVLLGSVPGRSGQMPLPPADYLDYRDQNSVFESMAAAELWSPSLTGGDRAEQVRGLHVSASLFDVLGVRPAIGRTFAAGDEAPGAPNAVVLSNAIWTRSFGGDSTILGRSIQLNGAPHVVIGVMPEGFHFPPFWANRAEIYATPAYRAALANDRRMSTLRVFARLRPGVSIEQAQAEVRTIAGRMAADHPNTHAGVSASLTSLTISPPASCGPRYGYCWPRYARRC